MVQTTIEERDIAGNRAGITLMEMMIKQGEESTAHAARIEQLESSFKDLQKEHKEQQQDLALLKPWIEKGIKIRRRVFETCFHDREITAEMPKEKVQRPVLNAGNQVAHEGNLLGDWAMCTQTDADSRYSANFRRAYEIELYGVQGLQSHDKLRDICNWRATAAFRQAKGNCTPARQKLIDKVDEALREYARTMDVAGSLFNGPLHNLVEQVKHLKSLALDV